MTVEAGPVSSRLLELQTIDGRIRETRDRAEAFGPKLEEVDEPARRMAEEVEEIAAKVKELRVEERRLQSSLDDKRDRVARLEERLNQVRTVRQQMAVQAELALVRRALDQEEMDVISLMDQAGRFEERRDERIAELEEARAEVEPRRRELLAEQERTAAEAESMQAERKLFAAEIDKRHLDIYDHLARGGRHKAVACMTADGACGLCFSLIPLQLQNEIRTSAPLVRCAACGVIVTAPLPEAGDEPPPPAE